MLTSTATGAEPANQGQQTAYQTLVSVNNIAEQSQFKTVSYQAITKYWNKAFFHNAATEEIFQAISGVSGTATAKGHRQAVDCTKISYDFIIDKKNYSQAQVQRRFETYGRKIFIKDGTTPGNVPEPENGMSLLDDFAQRLCYLRSFAIDLASPLLEETFKVRAAALNHGWEGCVVHADFVRVYAVSTCDHNTRKTMNNICNLMWGKTCCGTIEDLIMKKMKLVYDETCVDEKLKSKRKHGSIRKMITRLKQTRYINPIRMTGARVHREVIYDRKLETPMKCVLMVIKVTVDQYGFDGHLGLCSGHPLLLKLSQPLPAAKEVKEPSLFEFILEQQKKGNSSMTVGDILKVWDGNKSDQNKISHSPSATPVAVSAEATTPEQTTAAVTPPTTKVNPTSESTVQPAMPEAPPVHSPNRQGTKRSNEELSPVSRAVHKYTGCDHAPDALIPYERIHFNPRLCSQTNYPKECTGCNRSLLNGADKEKHCVIKGIYHIRCCYNAISNPESKCVLALCHECHHERVPPSPVQKKMKQARKERTTKYKRGVQTRAIL